MSDCANGPHKAHEHLCPVCEKKWPCNLQLAKSVQSALEENGHKFPNNCWHDLNPKHLRCELNKEE